MSSETAAALPIDVGHDRFAAGKRSTAVLMRDYAIVVAFGVLFVVLSATTANFLSTENLLNVLDQNAYVGIAACGATFVIIAGGFDLSVGAIYALAGVVAAYVTVHVGLGAGLLAGVLIGPILGAVNGSLVSVIGIHSFLATLASGLAFTGIAVAITGGFLIDISSNETFTWLGRDKPLAGIPASVLLFLLVVVVLWVVLSRTTFGRYVYAVGGNPEAARVSGLRNGWIVVWTFVVCGLTASLAGLIEVSRTGTGQPSPGGTDTLALDAIAAVVIGGTSIKGGQGAVWRTVLGVMLLALIRNGLNILNVQPQYQNIISALIIIVAVAINSIADRSSR